MDLKFKTILADPPWKFNDSLDKTRTLPYEVLSVSKLTQLDVDKIAEDNAHLYLWCPVPMLPEGLLVMECWGFEYKTTVPWLKRTKTGKVWFGMGHYFRNCFEFLLFGVRGSLMTRTNNTRNFIDAIKPQRHHSAKPKNAYEIIEANSYPPFLEMFATIRRDGWTSWGWEVQHKDIRENFSKGDMTL